MKTQQKRGKIKLPEGKKVAVNIGCDFDAQSIWIGSYNRTTPVYMSRGEYGAEVGVPRLLETFKKYGITTTFFIPGHTADTFPDACKEIIAHGHEIGHHGYAHHNPATMTYEEEDRVMQMGFESLAKLGVRPVGYRSPYWDFSPNTSAILEKYGFKYDSSLMAHDIYPYYPRPVEVNADRGNVFGEPSTVLELPASWHMDDFPFVEFVFGAGQDGNRPVSELYDRWTSIYDFTCRYEGGCFILVIHPQASGHPEYILNLERLIEYLQAHDAWITTAENIADAFVLDPFEE